MFSLVPRHGLASTVIKVTSCDKKEMVSINIGASITSNVENKGVATLCDRDIVDFVAHPTDAQVFPCNFVDPLVWIPTTSPCAAQKVKSHIPLSLVLVAEIQYT